MLGVSAQLGKASIVQSALSEVVGSPGSAKAALALFEPSALIKAAAGVHGGAFTEGACHVSAPR